MTPGDPKWTVLLNHANILIDAWAAEPYAYWQSLYEPDYQLGSVSTSASYDFDDDVMSLSTGFDDYVRIRSKTDPNHYYHYKTVLPEDLKAASGSVCARIGNGLRFSKVFTADSPEYGGQILAPVYVKPAHLVKPTDTVPMDNPNWLVVMIAANYALSKRTLESKYPLLLQEATQYMAGMRANNEAQTAEVPREPIGSATEW